jgi:hypothetical protein
MRDARRKKNSEIRTATLICDALLQCHPYCIADQEMTKSQKWGLSWFVPAEIMRESSLGVRIALAVMVVAELAFSQSANAQTIAPALRTSSAHRQRQQPRPAIPSRRCRRNSAAADHRRIAEVAFLECRSASKHFDELLNSEAGIGDDATQSAWPELFVIGNDDPRVRLIATKHHVTAALPPKNEPDALQGSADVPAGKIGGKFGHVALRAKSRLCCLDLDELLTCLRGHWIASIAAILNVKLDGFPDVVQRFRAVVTLADTSWQRRYAGDISAILFLLQNDGITHWTSPDGSRPSAWRETGGERSILAFHTPIPKRMQPNHSNQLQALQTGMPFLADDDVVVHGNTKRLRHGDDLLRHLDVRARRRRIAGGMIMQDAL